MHAHVLHTFAYVSAASAASPALTQPSMKDAKHEHACTLYGRRLHPTKIMDLRSLQAVPIKLSGLGIFKIFLTANL